MLYSLVSHDAILLQVLQKVKDCKQWMLTNKQFHKIICILVNICPCIGICTVGQYWLVVCLCVTGFAGESRSAFHLYLLILLAKQRDGELHAGRSRVQS